MYVRHIFHRPLQAIPCYDMRSEGYPHKWKSCRSPVLSAREKEGNHLPLFFRALHTAGNRGTVRTLPEYGVASHTQCLANAAWRNGGAFPWGILNLYRMKPLSGRPAESRKPLTRFCGTFGRLRSRAKGTERESRRLAERAFQDAGSHGKRWKVYESSTQVHQLWGTHPYPAAGVCGENRNPWIGSTGRETAGEAPQTGNRNLLLFCRQGRAARLKPDPSGSQPDRERQNFLHFFYFFISHEQRFTDYPISAEKGATAPFSCLPARMGSGKARIWVKGRVPCGYLGQRPKPSESLLLSISTIFKVRLSLIFGLSFFINHLTLSRFLILRIILLLHQNIFRNFIYKKDRV